MRKTIDVADLLEKANFMLNNSSVNYNAKEGIANMIESVLHQSGAYEGYRYLRTDAEGQPAENTEYYRAYFVHKNLRDGYQDYVQKRNFGGGLR